MHADPRSRGARERGPRPSGSAGRTTRGGRAPRRGRWSRRWPPPRGWRGARAAGAARRKPASARRRSSLRALHDRHEATTLSHAWGPPASGAPRGRCSPPPGCSTGTGARRGRRPPGARAGTRLRYGTRTKWCSRITAGTGMVARSEWSSRAVARDDLRLLLQHEHDRPAHRDDAERLEAGVEQQRSSQASGASSVASPTECRAESYRCGPRAGRGLPIARHHSRYATRSRGSGGVAAPYWVSKRKRR